MSLSKPRPGNRFLLLAALGGLLGLVGGCDMGPTLAPVSGRVTVNGQPLTSGSVTFHPDTSKGNTFGGLPVGDINAQGEYTLQTRGKPGAPLGHYKVTVAATGPTTSDNTKVNTKSLINTTYTNPGATPLEKEVVDKPAPGVYDLQVGP